MLRANDTNIILLLLSVSAFFLRLAETIETDFFCFEW